MARLRRPRTSRGSRCISISTAADQRLRRGARSHHRSGRGPHRALPASSLFRSSARAWEIGNDEHEAIVDACAAARASLASVLLARHLRAFGADRPGEDRPGGGPGRGPLGATDGPGSAPSRPAARAARKRISFRRRPRCRARRCPLISTRTRSPGARKTCGSRRKPTPPGVPVRISRLARASRTRRCG